MRHCLVTRRLYTCINPGESVQRHSGVDQPPVNAMLLQFINETQEDGGLVVVAVVEYKNGSVETVPLSWLKMLNEDNCDEL